MSRIRGRDTKPELVVRRWLWHQGFRYRLYVKSLPGRPDIVMRKWRTVIFVNGCFWHGHDCQSGRRPSTNARFWQEKIERNRERDARNVAALQAAGWHVLVVWECQLSTKCRQETLRELQGALAGAPGAQQDGEKLAIPQRLCSPREQLLARPFRLAHIVDLHNRLFLPPALT